MFHHIGRCASNVFDPHRFRGLESLGFDPPCPLSDNNIFSVIILWLCDKEREGWILSLPEKFECMENMGL